MILTRAELAKGLEPFCEWIRLRSGDSVEDFEPQKQNLISFYALLLEMAEKQYYKENPPKPKKPEITDPKAILESWIEFPENNDKLIGKETIFMSLQFDKVLKSRERAIPLSEKLKSNIQNNIHTKLNFKDVIYSDPSFMDEAIAQVLIAAGEEHFNCKVSIVYASKQIKEMIAYVIQGRKDFYIQMGANLFPKLRVAS